MRVSIAAITLIALGATPAFAHKLCVEAKPRTDHVHVEAYYDDDTPAQEAKITIHKGDAVVAEGRTDEKGVWTCMLPPGHYTVRAETLGHAAKETFDVPERVEEVAQPSDDQRAENTQFPIWRVVLGLGIIAAATTILYALRHRARCTR
jgi:hypothetical protein